MEWSNRDEKRAGKGETKADAAREQPARPLRSKRRERKAALLLRVSSGHKKEVKSSSWLSRSLLSLALFRFNTAGKGEQKTLSVLIALLRPAAARWGEKRGVSFLFLSFFLFE